MKGEEEVVREEVEEREGGEGVEVDHLGFWAMDSLKAKEAEEGEEAGKLLWLCCIIYQVIFIVNKLI